MRFTTLFATVVTASATANALAFTESFGAIKRDMVKRVVAPSGPGSGGSGSGGGGGGGGTGSGGQGSGGGIFYRCFSIFDRIRINVIMRGL